MKTLIQENVVLKSEVDVLKLRCRSLQEENRSLRQASVSIQARAEQEEEAISNKLMKKIQTLRQEKEKLANNYEQEEEFLTNDLSRKLEQLRQEKEELEQTLEQEQECQVQQLVKRLRRLEQETEGKQMTLDQLRQEEGRPREHPGARAGAACQSTLEAHGQAGEREASAGDQASAMHAACEPPCPTRTVAQVYR